jgi:hypothetical protein
MSVMCLMPLQRFPWRPAHQPAAMSSKTYFASKVRRYKLAPAGSVKEGLAPRTV